MKFLAIQMINNERAASQGSVQVNLNVSMQVVTFTLVDRMIFLFDDNDNVTRKDSRGLVAFTSKGNFLVIS
jgi:hypothetical protein